MNFIAFTRRSRLHNTAQCPSSDDTLDVTRLYGKDCRLSKPVSEDLKYSLSLLGIRFDMRTKLMVQKEGGQQSNNEKKD